MFILVMILNSLTLSFLSTNCLLYQVQIVCGIVLSADLKYSRFGHYQIKSYMTRRDIWHYDVNTTGHGMTSRYYYMTPCRGRFPFFLIDVLLCMKESLSPPPLPTENMPDSFILLFCCYFEFLLLPSAVQQAAMVFPLFYFLYFIFTLIENCWDDSTSFFRTYAFKAQQFLLVSFNSNTNRNAAYPDRLIGNYYFYAKICILL